MLTEQAFNEDLISLQKSLTYWLDPFHFSLQCRLAEGDALASRQSALPDKLESKDPKAG